MLYMCRTSELQGGGVEPYGHPGCHRLRSDHHGPRGTCLPRTARQEIEWADPGANQRGHPGHEQEATSWVSHGRTEQSPARIETMSIADPGGGGKRSPTSTRTAGQSLWAGRQFYAACVQNDRSSSDRRQAQLVGCLAVWGGRTRRSTEQLVHAPPAPDRKHDGTSGSEAKRIHPSPQAKLLQPIIIPHSAKREARPSTLHPTSPASVTPIRNHFSAPAIPALQYCFWPP